MRTARVHLHSDLCHPAHEHTIAVDADADGVPVERVSVVMVHGVPLARRRGDPVAERLGADVERALFVRDARAADGTWVFRDSGVRMRPSPPTSRPPSDPQIM